MELGFDARWPREATHDDTTISRGTADFCSEDRLLLSKHHSTAAPDYPSPLQSKPRVPGLTTVKTRPAHKTTMSGKY